MFLLKKKSFFSWDKVSKLLVSYFPLFLIIIIALYLRLNHLNRSVWLQPGYDESRDMLVASHIINNGENINRGPLAAGGMNWLQNSPFYYYLVSCIWFITKNPVSFMYFWAVLMTTPVILGYLIGSKLKDSRLGYILATILAVNYQMVYSSRELLQPHLLLIFSLAFILATISFLKTKKRKLFYLNLLIFLLFFPIHIHYGVLIVLPIGFVFSFYHWIKLNKDNHYSSLGIIFWPVMVLFNIFLSWLFLTFKEKPFDQLYFLKFNNEAKDISSVVDVVKQMYLLLNKMIWGSESLPKYLLLIIFVGFFIVVYRFLGTRKNIYKFVKSVDSKLISFLIIFSSSLLLFYFYHWNISATYILYIFPFILVLFSYLLYSLFSVNKYLAFGCIGFVILNMLLMTDFNIKNNLPVKSFHDQQQELAKIIYDDYKKSAVEDDSFTQPRLLLTWYTTIKNMPYDAWGTSGVWFYLENYFNEPLVYNVNYGLNHAPLFRDPKILYMVCDHRRDLDLIKAECLDRFLDSYPVNLETLKELSVGQYISLWRIELRDDTNVPIRNVVHKDYLIKN